MTEITTEPKKRGRPPKAKEQVIDREEMREPLRADPREEQELIYEPGEDEDRLKIPKEIIPDKMEYQWITHAILGQEMLNRRSRFMKAHWSPVPSERHDGLFMPKGYKGQIEVEGLGLYERPMWVSNKAREYERARRS